MEHLSNDRKDRPNQHENSHKLYVEMEHVLSLTESQWKLRQQHDQNFPKEKIQKTRTVSVTVRDLSREVNHLIKVHWVYQFYQNRLASPYDGC